MTLTPALLMIALCDEASVEANGSVLVDVLGNDVDAAGGLDPDPCSSRASRAKAAGADLHGRHAGHERGLTALQQDHPVQSGRHNAIADCFGLTVTALTPITSSASGSSALVAASHPPQLGRAITPAVGSYPSEQSHTGGWTDDDLLPGTSGCTSNFTGMINAPGWVASDS